MIARDRGMQIPFFTQDSRLSERAEYCLQKISEHPDRSFPQIFQKNADLEGFYRFLNNPRVSHEDLIASICRQSLESLPDQEMLLIHDTTPIVPDPKSKTGTGFGKLHGRGKGQRGFLAHVSLAVSPDAQPVIHGLVGASFWTRKGQAEGWEGKRWWTQIEAIERQRPSPDQKIHLMDREADVYPLFSHLQDIRARFVIRLQHDRCVKTGRHGKLFDELQEAPTLGKREIFLSKRTKVSFFKEAKINPTRAARKTTLWVAAKKIILDSSKRKNKKELQKEGLPSTLEANVVRVFEKKGPKKQKPVEWYLITSEPIETIEQVWRVVDLYRKRWVIEEFFKALKTGCALESRLFSALESWEKLVSLYLPIACQLFNLKNLTGPISGFFSASQMKILQSLAKRESSPLGSIQDAQLLVARLGGHIKYTGPPGWLVLARGYHELLSMEAGWKMHRNK